MTTANTDDKSPKSKKRYIYKEAFRIVDMGNKKRYIPYENYLKIDNDLNQMQKQGIKLIFKKNYIKMVGGVVCLSIAIFPNGLGIIFYPLGFYLLGWSSADFFRYKDIIIRQAKNKLRGWFKK